MPRIGAAGRGRAIPTRKMKLYKDCIKRLLDAAGSALLIILMSPAFALIWAVVRVSMGSPAVISQRRAGLRGKIFNLYKFRTMSFERGADGKLLPDERRITKVGAFLRKTSLDEIPQFFNVLKGDMSFIGPRPFLDYELDALDEKSMRRHDVLPGLSGLAQVSGRNEITVDRKIAKDLEYVDKISFALDAKIFFLTLVKVVFCVDSTPVNKNTVEKYSKGGRS